MDFFNCKGHIIHYKFQDNQSDRTLIFINSLGTDFRLWDEVLPALAPYGNFLLYDKRGHGLSDFWPSGNGLEDYAEDALLLLEHLSIRKCTAIGISVGGILAQIMAFRRPEKFDKLVLCDTASRIGNEETWNGRIAQVKEGGLQRIADDVMKRWFSHAFHKRYPEKVAGYRNMLANSPPDGYIQTCEAIRDSDIAEISGKLKIPALCIVGEADLTTTPEHVRAMAGSMVDGRFEIIRGAGHIPCVDSADTFSRLIIDFIK